MEIVSKVSIKSILTLLHFTDLLLPFYHSNVIVVGIIFIAMVENLLHTYDYEPFSGRTKFMQFISLTVWFCRCFESCSITFNNKQI